MKNLRGSKTGSLRFLFLKGEIKMCTNAYNGKIPQMKIFSGNFNGCTADQKFGEWIEDHPNIDILELRYQHARYGDHSIMIMYTEE